MKYTNNRYYYSPEQRPSVRRPSSWPHRFGRRLAVVFGAIIVVSTVGIAAAMTLGDKSAVVSAKQTPGSSVAKTAFAPAATPLQTTLPQSLATAMAGRTSHVDVAVYDSKTGQTIHYTNASDTYNTASIMKLSILEELLLQDQSNGTGITSDQLSYATPMIENSDNDAATELWDEVGQGVSMQDFFSEIGADSTTINEAGHWGLTQTTALDQLKVLGQFAYPNTSKLNSTSVATITNLLSNVESDQQWGVSGGVPSTASVLLKDGWLDDTDGWDVNSIGHVTNGNTDYTIAILTDKNTTEQGGIDMIGALSGIVYSALSSS